MNLEPVEFGQHLDTIVEGLQQGNSGLIQKTWSRIGKVSQQLNDSSGIGSGQCRYDDCKAKKEWLSVNFPSHWTLGEAFI